MDATRPSGFPANSNWKAPGSPSARKASLVIEPLPSGKGLLDLLVGWGALDESLPEISDPPPAEEIF
jgi:hypothetical protein